MMEDIWLSSIFNLSKTCTIFTSQKITKSTSWLETWLKSVSQKLNSKPCIPAGLVGDKPPNQISNLLPSSIFSLFCTHIPPPSCTPALLQFSQWKAPINALSPLSPDLWDLNQWSKAVVWEEFTISKIPKVVSESSIPIFNHHLIPFGGFQVILTWCQRLWEKLTLCSGTQWQGWLWGWRWHVIVAERWWRGYGNCCHSLRYLESTTLWSWEIDGDVGHQWYGSDRIEGWRRRRRKRRSVLMFRKQ